MGRKLRRLVGALQPNPSPLSPSAARLAVLRATSPRRPSSPPRPHHISSLLSFGRAARPSASALSSSLSSRLLSTTDPSVALKSLLSLHHLLSSAPFILLDSLSSALLPSSSGRLTRSPLLLSSFPLSSHSPFSWHLSSCVRSYSRFLELRLLLPNPNSDPSQWVSSLLNRDLIAELESFANFVAAALDAPEMGVGNRLLAEVGRMVRADRVTAEEGILVRVREVRERTGAVGFGDAVELVCVLRRLEEYGPVEAGRVWGEVGEVRGLVEGVVVGREKEARRVRREGISSVSDRFGVRTGEVVLFGSNRWVKQ